MPLFHSHRYDYAHLEIGPRIRNERQRRQLTLKDVERVTGISAARLSQIENGLHVIDLQQAFAVAGALGLERAAFLPRDVRIPYQITREEDTRPTRPHRIRLRTFDASAEVDHHSEFWPLADLFVGRHLEPMLAAIHPTTGERFYYHDDQEFFFVLAGSVEFSIRTSRGVFKDQINVGDCVYFNSSLPHLIRGIGEHPARALHVLAGSSAEVGAWAGPLATRHVYAHDGSDDAESASQLVGRRIRILREALRLQARQVAAVIGVTETQLLQIEQGRRDLDLDALIQLARAFGKPLREFTGEPAGADYLVMRRSEISALEGRVQRGSSGSTERVYKPLAAAFPFKHMYPYLVRIPNGQLRSTPREFHGQEFVYVLDGHIELTTTVEGRHVVEKLAPGDACYFDRSVPHAWHGFTRNPYSEISAEVINVLWCPAGEDYLFGALEEAGSTVSTSAT